MATTTKSKRFSMVQIEARTTTGITREPYVLDHFSRLKVEAPELGFYEVSHSTYSRPFFGRWPLGYFGENLVLSDPGWHSCRRTVTGDHRDGDVVDCESVRYNGDVITPDDNPSLFGAICAAFGMANPARR